MYKKIEVLSLLALCIGILMAPSGLAGDKSFKDSVVNIWDKVSDAAVDGSKVVKEKSVKFGKDVSDKAVGAWEWATEEDEPDMDEGAFGDDSVGVDSLQESYEEEQSEYEESFTGKVEKSAAELWGRVAEAFSDDDATGSQGYPERAELWDEVNVDLSEIADKLQKQDELPDSSLFGEDKESNRRKIDKMLSSVLEILEVTDVSERKQEYATLQSEILELNTEIIDYREKMILAPEKVEGVDKVWKNTVADYKNKIAAAESEIAEYRQRQKAILREIQEELLERSGIRLSDDQVYSLVVMVSGDSFVTLNSVFYNIKQLVDILERLADENKDYINSVKKYYGMYAVLVEALQLAHEIEIEKIENGYIPKLDEFRVKAELASKDTRKLIQKNKGNKENLVMLNNNLKAQAEIFTAAGAYKEYLSDYLVSLKDSKSVIDQQLLVVMDTWKTTQLASGLLSVMKSSAASMKDLVSMELPSIKPLNIGKLKDQLSMISLQIRQ